MNIFPIGSFPESPTTIAQVPRQSCLDVAASILNAGNGNSMAEALTEVAQETSEESLETIVDFVIEKLSDEELAELTFYLEDENVMAVVSERYRNELDESEEPADNLLTFIEAYTSWVEDCDNLLFLEFFFSGSGSRQISNTVVNDLESYSCHAQACLLYSWGSRSRKKVADNYQGDVSKLKDWLEHVLQLNPKTSLMNSIVKDLLYNMEEEDFFNFINSLLGDGPKSPIIPYLFTGLSHQTFSYLMLLNLADLMDLLNHGLHLDGPAAQFLIKKLHEIEGRPNVLLTGIPLLLGVNAVAVPFRSFITHHGLEHEAGLVAFMEPLRQLPPFLLALAMPSQEYRQILLSLAKHFTDEQLKAISFMLEDNGLIQTLESLEPPQLQYSSYATLISNLPSSGKRLFLEDKCNKLEKEFKKFKHRFKTLREICKNSSLPADPSELLLEANFLLGFTRSVLSPDYTFLEKLSLELFELEQDTALLTISRIRGACEQYQKLLAQPIHGIIFKFNSLSSNDAFEDEASGISEVYWKMLTLENLRAIGIESGSDILELGLKSDQDFESLGIGASKQSFLNDIKNHLYKNLPKDDSDTRVAILKVWDKILQIDMEPYTEPYENLVDELLDLFNLASIETSSLVIFCRIMLEALYNDQSLPDNWKQTISNSLESLTNIASTEDCCNNCGFSLRIAIAYRKLYDPLHQLKRYFSQKNLKAVWSNLHKKGLSSLTDLANQGMTSENMFQLEKFFGGVPEVSSL